MQPKVIILAVGAFALLILGVVGYFLHNLSNNQTELASTVTKLQTELASNNTQANAAINASTASITNADVPLQPSAIQSNSPPVEQATDINQIFAPSTGAGEENPEIHKIKADFESLFVNYQLLQHCQMTEPADYHIINSALAHEISSKNATGRIQYDILTAAKGTYEEIYARSDCASPQLAETNKQFRNYIQQYMPVRFVVP